MIRFFSHYHHAQRMKQTSENGGRFDDLTRLLQSAGSSWRQSTVTKLHLLAFCWLAIFTCWLRFFGYDVYEKKVWNHYLLQFQPQFRQGVFILVFDTETLYESTNLFQCSSAKYFDMTIAKKFSHRSAICISIVAKNTRNSQHCICGISSIVIPIKISLLRATSFATFEISII